MNVISQGSQGPVVIFLQHLMNVIEAPGVVEVLATDGLFGPRTSARVKGFQQSQQLVPDSIVGPMTWAKLGSARINRNRGGAVGASARQFAVTSPVPARMRPEEEAVMVSLVSDDDPPDWTDRLKEIALDAVSGPLGGVFI